MKYLILLTQLLKLFLIQKMNEVKTEIPSISGLATSALTAVEKKIPNVSNLVENN